MEVLMLQLFLCFIVTNTINSISLPNIALNKSAQQSGDFSSSLSGAEKAVDGLKSDLSYNGGQCAVSTDKVKTAWWRVDLGDISSINHITIYYRTENIDWTTSNGFVSTFLGFSVYISNTTDKDDGQLCFHDNGHFNLHTIPAVLTLNCTLYGRYVIYYNERKEGQPDYYYEYAGTNLCEFIVNGCEKGSFGENCTATCPDNCLHDLCDLVTGNCFQCDAGYTGSRCDTECVGGVYGQDCRHTCGACINNTHCHHINGSCLQGCGPGYQGDRCDEECSFGKYGINCQFNCSATCNASNTCNRTTGECIGGCEPGWKGTHCEQECDGGMYGQDCSNTCGSCINNTQCQHINGSCLQGCGPGYQGHICEEECPTGKYGNDCKYNCSATCVVSNTCNRTTGECVGGCTPGWKGFFCEQECDGGKFGQDCSYTCGSCINNTQCHHINGSCLHGCGPGYQGGKCVDGCPNGTYGNDCKNNCSITCIAVNRCTTTTGECMGGCKPGWKGYFCEQKCDGGMYGQDCSNTCGSCINNTQCQHINGSCLQGCGPGYLGEKCEEIESSQMMQKQPQYTEAIIGGVLGPTLIGAAVFVLVVFFRRWKSKNNANRKSDATKFNAGAENFGFSTLPENSKTQDTILKASPVKNEFGDVYENTEREPDIFTNELKQAIEVKSKDKNSGFKREYNLLPYGDNFPSTVGKQPANATKNRFKTTFPYDHSRVVLKMDNAISADYINANYIDGSQREHEYIASQGPKQNTVNDFWAMIWQENTSQIVMLTSLIEGSKVKCIKYWPDSGVEKQCGNMTLILEKEIHYASHAVRKMKLFNKAVNGSRLVTQYHYTSWPDHGTPEPLSLVLFHNHVKTSRPPDDSSPLVVHCSAGIGRTGTYIALDALYETGKKTGKVNVLEFVKAMRIDRMNMVQTYEQYMTIFVALFEAFRVPIEALKVPDFVQKAESLSNHEPANRTIIRKEFQQLLTILPEYGKEDYKFARESISTTNADKILPLDKYSLHLTPLPNCIGSFINAIYLSSYTEEKAIILSQYPSTRNVLDFLRLIQDHGSKHVIFMDSSDDVGELKSWIPATSTPVSYPPFTLSFQSASKSNVKTRTIVLTRTGNYALVYVHSGSGNSYRLYFISYFHKSRDFDASKVDENFKKLKNILQQENKTIVMAEPLTSIGTDISTQDTSSVRKLVNYALGISTENPIIVVSKDGAELCGVFCALYNCLQQMRIEDTIDVFTTVRQLQIRRPELCQSQEEYGFIYKALRDHIQSENENVYCNM